MPSTFEWIKLSADLLIPIVLLIVGLSLNRHLEQSKTQSTKEHEWESYWASEFLRVAGEYNKCATKIVTLMTFVARYVNEDNDIDRANEVIAEINGIVGSFTTLEWELQQYSDFAKRNGENVRVKGSRLFHALEAMLRDKHADLDEIRKIQFEFTDVVRLAHSEILSISPDRTL